MNIISKKLFKHKLTTFKIKTKINSNVKYFFINTNR